MQRTLLAAFVAATVAMSCLRCSPSISLGNALPITGTFSDFRYSEERRGLEGVEVRVVVAAEGYEATVQFAEGDPSVLTVVPIKFDFENIVVGQKFEVSGREESKLAFELPIGSHRPGRFSGAITRTHLEGAFTFTTGEVINVKLERRRSWWDR